MEYLVSIIIPIYNVEKYLEKCIKSMINQTYRNLEIILINDGSTDESANICEKYKEQDNRIVFINKNNGGAASAKNEGLKIAKGDYITFVDSDDFVELYMIEYMVNTIKKYNSDIVQCSFTNLYKNTEKFKQDKIIEQKIGSKDFLELFLTKWDSNLFWNKLFKREVIENVFFKEGRCIDDEFFTYKCVINSKSIVTSNKIVYNYRMRKSGVMKSESSQKQILKDRVDYLYERYEIVRKIYKDLDKDFLEHLLTYYLIISKDYYVDEKLLDYMKNNLKSIKGKIITSNIDIRVKMQILKFMMTKSDKYIQSKNQLEEVAIDEDIYFE
ncbi:glycosyltransferase family 2 protein [Intestinibacter bartlettii]|uniref:glycosyltransferase family 2 protein n=1 Tax=Intestinibacter bartlettii TaxID=261299 RepID=UPI00248D1011|nr:glycosyltransferase family 2 protein [Intestinibacter bartlettii]